MKWFKKHLNWTLFLGCLGMQVLSFFVGVFSPSGGFAFSIGIAASLVIANWFLEQKGRRKIHLLWIICPFGFFVLLGLKNNKLVAQ